MAVPSESARRVILDVDTGVDDALAIALTSASPELNLLAITCVAGNTALPSVVENTCALVAMTGMDAVEVSAGADRPLVRPEVSSQTAWVHGGAGRGYATLPEHTTAPSGRRAADTIISTARNHPKNVTLISTGPLTNVALAVRLDPDLPGLLRRLVLMGGAYTVGGNTTPCAEFNIHADPEAARIVFDAFSRATERPLAVGLDVTLQALLLPEQFAEIGQRGGDPITIQEGQEWGRPASPLMTYLAGALHRYAEYTSTLHGVYGTYLHDPSPSPRPSSQRS